MQKFSAACYLYEVEEPESSPDILLWAVEPEKVSLYRLRCLLYTSVTTKGPLTKPLSAMESSMKSNSSLRFSLIEI